MYGSETVTSRASKPLRSTAVAAVDEDAAAGIASLSGPSDLRANPDVTDEILQDPGVVVMESKVDNGKVLALGIHQKEKLENRLESPEAEAGKTGFCSSIDSTAISSSLGTLEPTPPGCDRSTNPQKSSEEATTATAVEKTESDHKNNNNLTASPKAKQKSHQKSKKPKRPKNSANPINTASESSIVLTGTPHSAGQDDIVSKLNSTSVSRIVGGTTTNVDIISEFQANTDLGTNEKGRHQLP